MRQQLAKKPFCNLDAVVMLRSNKGGDGVDNQDVVSGSCRCRSGDGRIQTQIHQIQLKVNKRRGYLQQQSVGFPGINFYLFTFQVVQFPSSFRVIRAVDEEGNCCFSSSTMRASVIWYIQDASRIMIQLAVARLQLKNFRRLALFQSIQSVSNIFPFGFVRLSCYGPSFIVEPALDVLTCMIKTIGKDISIFFLFRCLSGVFVFFLVELYAYVSQRSIEIHRVSIGYAVN